MLQLASRFRLLFCSSFVLAIASGSSAFADEGMWLFNAPPLKQLKEKYNFEPTPQWDTERSWDRLWS